MKVPVLSQIINNNTYSPNPKDNSSSSNNGRTIGFQSNTPSLCYEPKSVLDLRRSPSPAAARLSASATDPPLDHWDEHVLQSLDWDSIMRELDLHDDPVPALKASPSQFFSSDLSAPPPLIDTIQSDFNDIFLNPIVVGLSHNSFHSIVGSNNSNNVAGDGGFDFIQELIKASDSFDSNELQLAHVILERLNHRLHSPAGKPLQRAAFFFKEALSSLLSGSTRSPVTRLSSWSEIVETVRSYKAFSCISPIPMFTHFTTNQALLESLHGSQSLIHLIDFDIGFGSHHASFMRELVESYKLASPVLRITAVVTEEFAVETKLIKEILSQFARDLRIRFQIDFVLLRTFEMPSFKAIKFMEGEKTAVILSPTILRRLGSTTSVTAFATDIRSISPSVVVFVDSEGWVEHEGASFRRNFVKGLEFYSMMFESLDAAAVAGGRDWVRKIEMSLMKPRIMAAVEECERSVRAAWREAFYGAGMRAVKTSQFADFQAECLLGKVQMRGFHVAKREAELVLCWHERPIVAISAWKC